MQLTLKVFCDVGHRKLFHRANYKRVLIDARSEELKINAY